MSFTAAPIAQLTLEQLDIDVDRVDYHLKLNSNFEAIAAKTKEIVESQIAMITELRTILEVTGDLNSTVINQPDQTLLDALARLQGKLRLYNEFCPTALEAAISGAATPTGANPFLLHGAPPLDYATEAVKFSSGVAHTGWDRVDEDVALTFTIDIPIDPDLYFVFPCIQWRDIVETAVAGTGTPGVMHLRPNFSSEMIRIAPSGGEPAKTRIGFVHQIGQTNLGIVSVNWLAVGVRRAW